MKNMERLKILHINEFDTHDAIEYLPNSLCWIEIFGYPWESLPEDFEPKTLVHLELREGLLRHLWFETKHFPCLRRLDLSSSQNLMQTPDFSGMPNLEHLDLGRCKSLKEVHHSLGNCRKLIRLDLYGCESLERFPRVSGESLEYLNLEDCSSLEIFPEVMGNVKPSSIQYLTHMKKGELHLCNMKNLVALPSSICKLKCLVKMDVSFCSKFESLPEEIGDLENLEELDARFTLISRPPSSIVRLNKLKFLSFGKNRSAERVLFAFPRVNEGLRSLEILNLSYCSLIDGELLDDIGCLSSLKKLDLSGNNFEHLPRRIAQLGALRCLDLSHCKRLTQLPEFPVQLDTIEADWTNYWICNSLFRNLSLLQHDISSSDSLSLRVITGWRWHGMPRFPYQGIDGVSVYLPENWYIHDSFSGFAVCYHGILTDITAHLIPLNDDGVSCITPKLVLSNHSKYSLERNGIHFFLIPFAGLWDISKANGKTPNDYRHIMLSSSEKIKYIFRLLYKMN